MFHPSTRDSFGIQVKVCSWRHVKIISGVEDSGPKPPQSLYKALSVPLIHNNYVGRAHCLSFLPQVCYKVYVATTHAPKTQISMNFHYIWGFTTYVRLVLPISSRPTWAVTFASLVIESWVWDRVAIILHRMRRTDHLYKSNLIRHGTLG